MPANTKWNNGERRHLLAGFDPATTSSKGYSRAHGIDWRTWRRWLKDKDKIFKSKRKATKATLGGQGRKPMFPFGAELLEFMNNVRDEEHYLTHTHMVTFIKTHHMVWLEAYLVNKKSDDTGYFMPVETKMPQVDMTQIRDEFAASFWSKFRMTDTCDIINVDETSVYYDMPPGKTLAKIGGSSKVDKTQKHSDRMTPKLPILFILKGTHGGLIERHEILTYSSGHDVYLNDLLKFEIDGPSDLMADNLEAHVTPESYDTVASKLFSVLQPLPKNTTNMCQPLDVGVMGPLKSKLRSMWLHEVPVVTTSEKRHAMILRTIAAWEAMPNTLVTRAFSKALPDVNVAVA
ncbi:hypothetical protein DYB36_008532 [Aphanomyces astaci]|uniref:DDE-1 domain-containing protein n=1 Tax=Aphanomyces astaci TaxID=112090 RepID=A0A397A8U3_APHAT|nr:hypothetical protein DYB36_008532 [Aphanomyces astaci]